jgi:hypothetical protein
MHAKSYEMLGVPNMNVFTRLPSVQGYGSLESTNYDDATGTHPQAAVDPCRLADGTFSQLRLATIVVASSKLGNNTQGAGAAEPNCKLATPTTHADRYFGQLLHVRTVTVHGRGGRLVAKGPVTLHLLSANGGVLATVCRRARRQRHDLHLAGRVAERRRLRTGRHAPGDSRERARHDE